MFKKHIPNTITCLNLISGCIATFWAFEGDYQMALLFIIIGAVFDFFDGMTARLLHVSSPIGKELDSLADVITFGFAPSAIIFSYLTELCAATNFSLFTLDSTIPYLAFVLAAFSAVRLAKFNLDERQAMGFIGLPTPANALFWGSLIVGSHRWLESMSWAPWLLLALMLMSCWLLVCDVPMFALKFKHWGWRGNEVRYLYLLSCVPILAFFGISGIAVVIAWYVCLSVLTQRLPRQQA